MSIMRCRSNYQAKYVCINKSCPHKSAFLCADDKEKCHQDHQFCSLASWTFLVKRVSILQRSHQKASQSLQLKQVYNSLLNAVRQIQNILNVDRKKQQMQSLIQSSQITPEKKVKISQFINESMNQAVDQNDNPNLREIQIKLDQARIQIVQYLRFLKHKRQGRTDQFNRESLLPPSSNIKIRQDHSDIVSSGVKFSKVFNNPKQTKSGLQQIYPSKIEAVKLEETFGAGQSSPIREKTRKQPKKQTGFSPKITSIIKNHYPKGPLFSKITNDTQTIYTLFYQKFSKANLLYRASQNDFLVSKFHQKCDGKSHTLTIVLTQYDKIIGGYTQIPWKSGGGQWYPDEKKQSFLFNLSSGQKYPLQVAQKAIWCSKTFGPSFGHPDLEIADKAIHNSNSCANFPMCYNNGDYKMGQASTQLFCGSKTGCFRIRQWQVYELQFPSI